MKSRSLVCIATIAAFGFGTAAQAQQWRGGESHDQRQEQRQQARAERHSQGQVQAQPQQHWQQRQQTQQWQQPHAQWQAPVQQQHYAQRSYNQQPYQTHAYNNYEPRAYSHGYYGSPQYRAYGNYGQRYYVGGYAPSYSSHRYWINDWRARNLYAPPYGYQWVQTDTGDVLLLALATGLIANAIMAQ